MDKHLVGAIVFAALGLCLLAPGLYSLGSTARSYFGLETAAGVVVDVLAGPAVKTGGAERRTPVVRFTTAEGKEVTVKSARAYSAVPFQEGDSVRVRYPRANPEGAMIDTFFEVWGLGALLSGFGAAFLLAGWLLFQRAR